MTSRATRPMCVFGVCVLALATAGAQQKPDPRIGLKPGLHDAGEAAWNLERLANLAKPEGFFDPKTPAGTPTPPSATPRRGRPTQFRRSRERGQTPISRYSHLPRTPRAGTPISDGRQRPRSLRIHS